MLKKKLSQNNLNLLLAGLGVLVLLAAYFLGYNKLTAANDEIETTLSERSEYLNQLEGYYANLPIFEKGQQEAEENMAKNLDRLPCGIENEDFLLYMMKINDACGTKMDNISFASNEVVEEFQTMINGVQTNVTGYRASVSTSGSMNYEKFKKYLNYVYNETPEVTYLNSVSIVYSGAASTINTSVNLSKFFIKYENSEYKPVPGPSVAYGKKNLFG